MRRPSAARNIAWPDPNLFPFIKPRVLTAEQKELKWQQKLIGGQVFALLTLAVTGAVVSITEYINPSFFNYPYLKPFRFATIIGFWPLLLYAAIGAYLSSTKLKSSRLDEEILILSIISSVLAGIWEELGFRCLYICVAMIIIVITNWIWPSVFAVLLVVGFIAMGINTFTWTRLSPTKTILARILGVLSIAAGVWLAYLAWTTIDPLFWLYENIFVPVINVFTLGYFHQIFYGPDYTRLFVFGMIAANAKFRDGHKYQGPAGMINAWVVGFIMMYATLNYGLMTAIILHVIYDAEFAIIHYLGRKTEIV